MGALKQKEMKARIGPSGKLLFLKYNKKPIKENCNYIFSELKYSGKNKHFLDPLELQSNLHEVDQLSLDLRSYINVNEYFYGGLICTVCSPKYNRYFWMNKDKPVFRVSMSMCSKLLEIAKIETRMARLYKYFFHPIARAINCINERETDPLFALMDVDQTYFANLKSKVNDCSNDFSDSNPACIEVCRRDFFTYNFPSTLIENYKGALKTIFEEFTEISIESYYKNIRGYELENIQTTKIEFINVNTKEAALVNMKNTVFELKTTGMNVFYNHMSIFDKEMILGVLSFGFMSCFFLWKS